jgi:hypothetical protein
MQKEKTNKVILEVQNIKSPDDLKKKKDCCDCGCKNDPKFTKKIIKK